MQGILNIEDDIYPLDLKLIPDPPKNLYWKGTLSREIFDNCLAVIGSRKMSSYGEKALEHLFSRLSLSITIVSGFMYGVDAKAHKEALKRNLKTIAVLPCGLEYIYPAEHKKLYNDILDSGGLLLSEYEGSLGPKTWTYLRRNRIVAGLSRALMVIEASENSGSLNTAELGFLYNRTVLAVPGNMFNEYSKGCLQLIREGASCVDCDFNINEIFGLENSSLFVPSAVGVNQRNFTNENLSLINALRILPLSLKDLSVYLSIPISILSSKIMQLSNKGLIIEKDGKYYAR